MLCNEGVFCQQMVFVVVTFCVAQHCLRWQDSEEGYYLGNLLMWKRAFKNDVLFKSFYGDEPRQSAIKSIFTEWWFVKYLTEQKMMHDFSFWELQIEIKRWEVSGFCVKEVTHIHKWVSVESEPTRAARVLKFLRLTLGQMTAVAKIRLCMSQQG